MFHHYDIIIMKFHNRSYLVVIQFGLIKDKIDLTDKKGKLFIYWSNYKSSFQKLFDLNPHTQFLYLVTHTMPVYIRLN